MNANKISTKNKFDALSLLCPNCDDLCCACVYSGKSSIQNVKNKICSERSVQTQECDSNLQLIDLQSNNMSSDNMYTGQNNHSLDQNTSGSLFYTQIDNAISNCAIMDKSLRTDSHDVVNNLNKHSWQMLPNGHNYHSLPYVCIYFITVLLLFLCASVLCYDKVCGSNNQDYSQGNIYNFESKGLKICSHNVNRLENKLEEIRFNLLRYDNPPDILGCCETFFGNEILDQNIQVSGFTMTRKDRDTDRGGGWVVFINESLSFERKEQFEISDIETVWFEIKPPYKKSFLLCFVYRNPKSPSAWIDKLEEEIQIAFTYNNDVILTGDLNMDFLSPNKPPQKWLNVLETYNLVQLITQPTRETKDSRTLIDHIYVTNIEQVYESHVVHYSVSDHYPICMTRYSKVTYNKNNTHKTITYRNCKNLNENAFLQDLKDAPFCSVESENDPDLCLQQWYSIFISVLDKHAPLITKRIKKYHQPEWYNSEITEARQTRDRCHKLGMWQEYKTWRNKTILITKKAKYNYFSEAVKNSKDPKTLWKCINTLNPKYFASPSSLKKDDGTTLTDPSDVANKFNDFFTSCVENLRGKSTDKPANFKTLRSFVESKLPHDMNFKIQPVNMNALYGELCSLNVNKSSGIDTISPRILRISAPAIVSSLTYIFNRIIDSGKFPTLFKNAKVTPIYKKGDKTEATNYRPISVLPTLSKLIEKHVSKQFYKYLSEFNLLHPSQSGFRPIHSCQTALTNITDKWLQEMNEGNINRVIFLDLKKAFDVVDHSLLCQKLDIYGCDEQSHKLFESYLNYRTQQVMIGNVKSKSAPISYGVPQGSILGPLLFILYINDLPLQVGKSTADMYADDSTFYTSGKNTMEIQQILQTDMTSITKWCSDNMMYINIETRGP